MLLALLVPRLRPWFPRIAVAGLALDLALLGLRYQPAVPLRANQSLAIPLAFKPVKGHTYTVTVVANDPHGHNETRVALLRA